jgi:hypothetical protein
MVNCTLRRTVSDIDRMAGCGVMTHAYGLLRTIHWTYIDVSIIRWQIDAVIGNWRQKYHLNYVEGEVL